MTTAEYNICVDNYSDGVYRFILKNIKDKDKAKDIVQDSFVKMWEKVKEVSYEKARAYLFTTAYRTMIDSIRKDSRQTGMDEEEQFGASSDSGQYSDLKEILDEALKKLPDVQRSVILLRDYEGYSYEEIGKIVGLNESQVKVYIYRARMTLKEYIGSIEAVI